MPSTRAPSSACVRLSGASCQVFPERAEPVFGGDAEYARAVLRYAGREAGAERYQRQVGNSFITMGEALLAGLPGALPEQDMVLLACHAPDLFHHEVAGCYLAERLPGTPVPCSVGSQGPGSVFTALRIADGLCQLGELGRGLLFGYDQNAVLWNPRHPARDLPDAAVLLQFGARGDVAVTCLDEVPAGPQGLGAAAVFQAARERSPGVPAVVGHSLWDQLDGQAGPGVTPATGLWSTGVWAHLARCWPLREPVLVADYDPGGQRVYLALLVPEDAP
jgi:hypothetical protein